MKFASIIRIIFYLIWILTFFYVFEFILFTKNIIYQNKTNLPLPDSIDRLKIYQKYNLKDYDFFSPTEFFLYNKKQILPDIIENPNSTYPTFGAISNKLTFFISNEDGKYHSYLSDRYGFNNDDNIFTNDPNDISTIFLGDSFVEGYAVNQKDHFISLLNNKNIYNLGMGGSSTLKQLAALKEFKNLFKLKSLYIFFFAGDDYNKILTEYGDEKLVKYLELDFTNNIQNKMQTINELNMDYLNDFYEQKEEIKIKKKLPAIISFIKLFNIRNLFPNLSRSRQNHKKTMIVFEKILEQIKRLSQEDKFSVNFIYLPDYDSIYFNKKPFWYDDLINLTKSKNIKVYDFQDYIKGKALSINELYPFGLEAHFSNKGNYFLAEFINKIAVNK